MTERDLPAPPEEWLRYAAEDLRVALLEAGLVSPRVQCFHAQQAVEKAIKGLLTSLGIGFPKRHDLNLLNELLPENLRIGAPASESGVADEMGNGTPLSRRLAGRQRRRRGWWVCAREFGARRRAGPIA
jgi:hypothetical protein